MIKTIKVYPRFYVERLFLSERKLLNNETLISIYSTPKEKLFDNKFNILSLCFSDCTKTIYNEIMLKPNDYELSLFSEDQAKEIIKFVDNLSSDIETLYVHCDAGVSRSGAVGLFVCRYLKLDENEFIKENPHIHPNEFVMEVLNKVSGINNDYVSFWSNQEFIQI